MLRLTVALAVLVATLVTGHELMAQRRTPLKNIAQQIGHRWGAGNHVYNRGPVSNYYSPWSETNTPDHQHTGSGAAPGQDSFFDRPATDQNPGIENSATHLLRQQPIEGNRYQAPIQPQIRIIPGTTAGDAAWQQNRELNQRMKPYRNTGNRPATGQINNTTNSDWLGNPSSGTINPAQNGLGSQYEQQFRNSRPFVPGNQ